MAQKTLGTAHVHGTRSTIANLTIISEDLEKGYEVDQKTQGSSGATVEKRRENEMVTGTITGYCTVASFAGISRDLIITLSGFEDADLNKSYTIEKVGNAYKAGDKMQVTLTLEHLESLSADYIVGWA